MGGSINPNFQLIPISFQKSFQKYIRNLPEIFLYAKTHALDSSVNNFLCMDFKLQNKKYYKDKHGDISKKFFLLQTNIK